MELHHLADLGRIPEEAGPELDRSISFALEEDGDNIKAAFDSELSRITEFHRKKVRLCRYAWRFCKETYVDNVL